MATTKSAQATAKAKSKAKAEAKAKAATGVKDPVTPPAPPATPDPQAEIPSSPNPPAPIMTQSEKDAGLIAANPAANPYELLQLGLSQSGFETMLNGGIITAPPAPPEITDLEKAGDLAKEALAKEDLQKTADDKKQKADAKPAPIKPRLVEKITGALPKSKVISTVKSVDNSGGVNVTNGKGQKQRLSLKAAQRLIRMDAQYKIIPD